MKISSPISGGVLFKLKKPCKAIKLPLRLVWLDRAVLLHGDEQDVVFEEKGFQFETEFLLKMEKDIQIIRVITMKDILIFI